MTRNCVLKSILFSPFIYGFCSLTVCLGESADSSFLSGNPKPLITPVLPGGTRTSVMTAGSMLAKGVNELLIDLAHGDAALRSTAAYYLGALGTKARSAVPALTTAALRDSSNWVRRSSVKALAKIGSPDVWPTIHLARNDADPWVRHSADNVLRRSANNGARYRLAKDSQNSSAGNTPFFKANGDTVKRIK